MNKFICLLNTRFTKNLTPISGHTFVETYSNEDVSILQCEFCNKTSVGYYFNPFPGDKGVSDEV